MAHWFYTGDRNLAEGGAYIRMTPEERKAGYANCVRVTPCADAGGQSNAWWVEALVIILPRDDGELKRVLDVHGITPDDLPKGVGLRAKMLAEMSLHYGLYDPATCYRYREGFGQCEVVQIGQDENGRGDVEPTVRLPAYRSLRRYVADFRALHFPW